MKDKENRNYWIEIIGVLVAIAIIYVWYDFFCFNDGQPWSVRGQMGDSFGVLNTLFSGLAFAGIVFTILLQRRELSLQRNELKQTREEFTTNRLTNILYQQINIQQKAISEFSIREFKAHTIKGTIDNLYVGNSAFLFLYNQADPFRVPVDDPRTNEEIQKDKAKHYSKNLSRYMDFEKPLLDFTARTNNSVRVIKKILGNSQLEINEMKQFVDLFFDNVGYSALYVLQDIQETFNGYIQTDKNDDDLIDFGKMGFVNINIKNIMKLKELDFNREREQIIKDLLE